MISIESFRNIREKRHIIVLDTNILLELYRQPANISLDIIEALKRVKDDVYIPRQVYDEYLRNYQAICGSERKKYQKVSKELSEAVRRLQEDIHTKTGEYRKHNYTDISKLQSDLDEKIVDIQRIIKDFENKHKTEIRLNMDFLQNDRVKEFVDLLVKQGCVEGELLFSQKMHILQEGQLRFDNFIPPGYMDYAKGGSDKYGDLFVWKSIITVAKGKSANILFICNDIKEDWWEKDKESPVELRKELLNEFKEYNPLLDIHFLTLEKFFSYLAEELKIGQSKSALQLSAKEYIDNQLEQYEEEIEKNIEKFFATVDAQELLGEWLLNVENEEIYWIIRDVSVDKEDKKVIYYIDLDISILADFIDDEDSENQRLDGKLAIALDGKLRLLTEEYSTENEIESIEIEIVDTLHVEPQIWDIVKKGNQKHSCREIIAASKEMVKYQDKIKIDQNCMENISELERGIQQNAGIYGRAIDPFSTNARVTELAQSLSRIAGVSDVLLANTRIAELASPLSKVAGVSDALSAGTRIAELTRPLSEIVGVTDAFSVGAKIAEVISPLSEVARAADVLCESRRMKEMDSPLSEIVGVADTSSASERVEEVVNTSIKNSSMSELINNGGKTK